MEAFVWPAAAVILVIAGMLIFRRPLTAFFSRTTSLALWGGRVEATPAPQVPAPKGDESQDLMKAFDNALLVLNENSINADLKEQKLDGQVAAIPVLVRHIAATQIALHFERVYSTIFGSQLAMLQHSNTRGNSGAPLEALKPFYQQAAATYAPLYQNYPFESYMGFLASHMLIETKGHEAFITLVGREFLKWTIDEGKGFRAG